MKRSLLAAAAALALAPSAASAALILNVETITLPASPQADFTGNIEVFFTEQAPAEDENLTAFNIKLDLTQGGTNIAFVPPAVVPTDHPFVFQGVSATVTDFGSDATTVLFGADVANASAQNIDDTEGVLRIPVRIPAGTPEGFYPIVVDEANTVFTNPATDTILFAIQNGGVQVGPIPEPTTFGLVTLGGGLLALRRRRKAALNA